MQIVHYCLKKQIMPEYLSASEPGSDFRKIWIETQEILRNTELDLQIELGKAEIEGKQLDSCQWFLINERGKILIESAYLKH